MKMKALNEWLTLVANFGVFAGLILLAFEVNQATRLATTEANVSRYFEIQQSQQEYALSDRLAEIEIKAKREGVSALTQVERARLTEWERARSYGILSSYYRYKQGYVDRDTAEFSIGRAAQKWQLWRQLGISIPDSELRTEVEQAMQDMAESE